LSAFNVGWQELKQGLYPVKESGRLIGLDDNFCRVTLNVYPSSPIVLSAVLFNDNSISPLVALGFTTTFLPGARDSFSVNNPLTYAVSLPDGLEIIILSGNT